MRNIRLISLLFIDFFISCISLYFSYSLVYQEFIFYKNINTIDYLVAAFLLISIFLISKTYFNRARFLPKDTFSLYFKYLFYYLIIFLFINHFFLFEINKFFGSNLFYGKFIPRSVLIINVLILFFLIVISRKFIEFLLSYENSITKYFNQDRYQKVLPKDFA